MSITGIVGDDGRVEHYVGNLIDISERKQREAELARYQEHLEEIVRERTAELHAREADLQHAQSVAAIGSWVFDVMPGTLSWSIETYRIFGISEGSPISYARYLESIEPGDLERVDVAWKAAMLGRAYDVDYRIRVGGALRWVRALAEFEFDGAGTPRRAVGTVQDITERKEREEMVWRQANFDALTGLANRNLLFDRLERALAQARRTEKMLGLLFIDLDAFKPINDDHGHEIGDMVLVAVAERLQQCVRDQDTVARLGGDEFVVVVHNLDTMERLPLIAEKLLAALREPFPFISSHALSASIGASVFPRDGDDVQSLIRIADHAMYQGKQSGKNRFHCYHSDLPAGLEEAEDRLQSRRRDSPAEP
jgi:diguanylate cyclase (GGDEF)-like protein/PAS domain S-box-containing protein